MAAQRELGMGFVNLKNTHIMLESAEKGNFDEVLNFNAINYAAGIKRKAENKKEKIKKKENREINK